MYSADFRESLAAGYWDEYLKGGVTTSEFAVFMAEDAECAFVNGADLAAILAACATVETYLRTEAIGEVSPSVTFHALIEQSSLPAELKSDLNRIRSYRNRWVHVRDPSDDKKLLDRPERIKGEIAEVADLAIRSMIRTICSNPWV